VFRRQGVEVRWLGGGLYLEAQGQGLLIDAPTGVAKVLTAMETLERVQSVILTGGRLLSVDGLLGLLCALEPHRPEDHSLELRFPLGEERPATLASAWRSGWLPRYPLSLDGMMPGESLCAGPFTVYTQRILRGEPRWRPTPGVERVVAMALRVEVAGVSVAWVPGGATSRSMARLCQGVDLAVVEVGVQPWPRSAHRWRLSMDDAVNIASEADSAWLVGDDGRPMGDKDTN